MVKSRCTVLATALLLTGLSGGAVSADKSFHRARTSQLIVQLADDGMRRIQSVGRGQAIPGVWLPDGREMKFVRRFGEDSMVVQLPEEVSLEDAGRIAAQLAEQPGIAAVEPDKRFYPALRPNDPLYIGPVLNSIQNPGQWNLFELTAGINMEAGWDVSTGSSSTVIAILDTGIPKLNTGSAGHRDLDVDRLLPGYDFITDVFTANDGGGRDDDPSDPGDWVEAGAECFTGDPKLDRSSWHGLSVTGVIGATSQNATDIAGINFNAKLLPVRVLGRCGGLLSDVADAIRWAAGLSVAGAPLNPTPARVINLSLTGDGACSTIEQNAIDAAVNAGAVVVAAAGNDGGSVERFSPANCNNVIVANSIARDGRVAAYSNTGPSVDITAPGGDDPDPPDPVNNPPNGILTISNSGDTVPAGDAIAVIQGTSFSAAQVSAVASLLLAVNPDLSAEVLEQVLKGTAREFPDSSCDTSLCGAGVLDAAAALEGASDPSPFVQKAVDVGAGGGGGGGGGCTLAGAGVTRFDPLWLVLAIGALTGRLRRRLSGR
ncbi:MAG: S8 family serine peptidase [Thiogranum sp.]